MPNGPSSAETRRVLVVEDERELADLYTEWLQPAFDAEAVYGGEKAIDALDQGWDAVLLDRRMPGVTGDEVLSEARSMGHEYPVAMVTAVEPDFDIVEMGFDDYIVKPVTREDLHDTVEQLIGLGDYDSAMQQYFSLASKKAALETNKTERELQNSSEYQELKQRLEAVQQQVDANRDSFFEGGAADGVFKDRMNGSKQSGAGINGDH
jgi:DNA-binding response OmpR family regulator